MENDEQVGTQGQSTAADNTIGGNLPLATVGYRATYQAEEILRVLGDPRDHAEVKALIGPSLVSFS